MSPTRPSGGEEIEWSDSLQLMRCEASNGAPFTAANSHGEDHSRIIQKQE